MHVQGHTIYLHIFFCSTVFSVDCQQREHARMCKTCVCVAQRSIYQRTSCWNKAWSYMCVSPSQDRGRSSFCSLLHQCAGAKLVPTFCTATPRDIPGVSAVGVASWGQPQFVLVKTEPCSSGSLVFLSVSSCTLHIAPCRALLIMMHV